MRGLTLFPGLCTRKGGKVPPRSAYRRRRCGFSLVEAAIVLGVIGLVVGGIWVAVVAVLQKQRINETASAIVQVAAEARQLFPYGNYPTVNNTWDDATLTLSAAGILPGGVVCCHGTHYARTSMGLDFSATLVCYGAYGLCPSFMIKIGYSYEISTLTESDCTELLHQVAGRAKNDLVVVQIVNFDAPLNIWMPANTTHFPTASCPHEAKSISFYFKP